MSKIIASCWATSLTFLPQPIHSQSDYERYGRIQPMRDDMARHAAIFLLLEAMQPGYDPLAPGERATLSWLIYTAQRQHGQYGLSIVEARAAAHEAWRGGTNHIRTHISGAQAWMAIAPRTPQAQFAWAWRDLFGIGAMIQVMQP